MIQAAAPADYRAKEIAPQKIKKQSGEPVTFTLVENPDVAATLGREKREGQVFVGFAAETNDVLAHAQDKLVRKNLDMIVANDVTRPGAGFGVDTNVVTLITLGKVRKPADDDQGGSRGQILDHVMKAEIKRISELSFELKRQFFF